MTKLADDLLAIIEIRANEHGANAGEELAFAMFTAGAAKLRAVRGPRFMVEMFDGLAQDYTNEVLGRMPPSAPVRR